MNKKYVALLTIVALVTISIGVVTAQGRRNGNGNGNGVCDPEYPQECVTEPQQNAFGYGGMGFVNPQTGAQWNGQQRGRMGRGAGMQGTGMFTALPPAYDGDLPQDVVDLMIDGWLDEQHAYAVYETVIEQFGDVNPFVNIQRAEAQHISAWEFLFDRYGIEAPALPEFDPVGFDSVSDACNVAADAEIANFGLYDAMLEAFANYPDIYQVALALRNASEFNHLPAFQNCAS